MEKTETHPHTNHSHQVVPSEEDEEALPPVANKGVWMGRFYYHYNGFWCPATIFPNVVRFQRNFQAKDTDFILASMPKSGTTWLKALAFSIVNRAKYPIARSPLLTTNPHALVPFLEFDTYNKKHPTVNTSLDQGNIPCPRLFATHLHYSGLPTSILDSKCRVIYICRNPLDQFVSHWHFANTGKKDVNAMQEELDINKAFESFCQGVQGFGPFWDHVLGYWSASLKYPQKMLFLKYEDLKIDPIAGVKKIAEFMGVPFSEEEERNGLAGEIVKICSFECLKNLQVNKKGGEAQTALGVDNSFYFRKGKIGDWMNYLTPYMAERVHKIMEEKAGELGLTFAWPNNKDSALDQSIEIN